MLRMPSIGCRGVRRTWTGRVRRCSKVAIENDAQTAGARCICRVEFVLAARMCECQRVSDCNTMGCLVNPHSMARVMQHCTHSDRWRALRGHIRRRPPLARTLPPRLFCDDGRVKQAQAGTPKNTKPSVVANAVLRHTTTVDRHLHHRQLFWDGRWLRLLNGFARTTPRRSRRR